MLVLMLKLKLNLKTMAATVVASILAMSAMAGTTRSNRAGAGAAERRDPRDRHTAIRVSGGGRQVSRGQRAHDRPGRRD